MITFLFPLSLSPSLCLPFFSLYCTHPTYQKHNKPCGAIHNNGSYLLVSYLLFPTKSWVFYNKNLESCFTKQLPSFLLDGEVIWQVRKCPLTKVFDLQAFYLSHTSIKGTARKQPTYISHVTLAF